MNGLSVALRQSLHTAGKSVISEPERLMSDFGPAGGILVFLVSLYCCRRSIGGCRREEGRGVAVVVVVVAGVLLLLGALCQAFDKKKKMTVAALPAY